MVSLMVVGMISAVIVPSLFRAKPDETAIMLKKAYQVTGKALNGMMNNEYSSEDCTNGFNCDTAEKFCKNFAKYFNKLEYTEANCNWNNIKYEKDMEHKSFMTTTDGMMWYMIIYSNCQNKNNSNCTNNGSYFYKIIVDVNGKKKPNCQYLGGQACNSDVGAYFGLYDKDLNGNAIHTCKDNNAQNVSCDNPDTFLISINAMGKIWPATGSWDPQKSCEFEKDCELLKSPTKLSW